MEPAITVEGVSKRYQLGMPRHTTLREMLDHKARTLFAPLSRRSSDKTGEFWALQDVSLTIQPGEVVGIIGRNGAGKSTLLKILSRITEPTKGSIRIRGRVASLLEVGTGFHPELTGRDNIFLNGAILGMRRAEIRARFDEIVAFAELEHFLDTPVKHYSSGMYVRLAFAVSAHLEPEILIVDEVLAVGDAQFQRKCLGRINKAARDEGRTILFVSHNMSAVRALCTRAILLHQGRIAEQGPAAELIDRYLETNAPRISETPIDLCGTPRIGGNSGRAEITRILINGGHPPCHGMPCSIQLTLHCKAACEQVSIGVGFSNLDGIRIMTVESDLEGPRQDLPIGGTISVTVTIDRLHLQPGSYLVDLGLRSGDFNSLDYLPSALQIEVLPGSSTPSSIIRDGPHVRYPANWQIKVE